MTDQIKEQIRFNTELLRLISVFLLANSGGVTALILGNVDSGKKIVFISAGIFIIFVCIVGVYSTYARTKELLKDN